MLLYCGDESLDEFPGVKTVTVLAEDLVYLYRELPPILISNQVNLGVFLTHLEVLNTFLSVPHFVRA